MRVRLPQASAFAATSSHPSRIALVILAGLCIASAPLDAETIEPQRLRTGSPRSVSTNTRMIPLGYESVSGARAASVDLDRDGLPEIAIASTSEVVVIRYGGWRETFLVWKAASKGSPTAMTSGDVDGDGFLDLVIGWGEHKRSPNAPARLMVYRTRGAPDNDLIEEQIIAPKTTRAQFTSLSVTQLAPDGPVGVLYSNFSSKYDASGGFAHLEFSDDGASHKWSTKKLYGIRMGTYAASALLGPNGEERALVVGRPYGNQSKTVGDVFILGDDGKRTPLPSLRGVRSLAGLVLGSPGQYRFMACYGDGWHWQYREKAKGRITCTQRDEKGELVSELIDETLGFEVNSLASADLNGDFVEELIARGPKALYRYIPVVAVDGLRTWDPREIGPGGKYFAVVDVDGDNRDEIILGGEKPSLLKLR